MSSETALANARREFMLLSGKEVLVRRIRGQGSSDQAVALNLAIPVPARIDPSRELCFERYKGDGRVLLPVYPIEFLGRHPGLSKVVPLWTYGIPQGPNGPLQPEEGPAFALVPQELRPAYSALPGVPKIMGAADGPARIIVKLYVRGERGTAHVQETVDLTDRVLACNLADLNEIIAGRVEFAAHVMPREAGSWDFSNANRAEVTRAVRAAFGISKGKVSREMLDELRRGPRRSAAEMIVARLKQDDATVERDVAPVLLRMTLREIQALRDGHATTDALGRYFRGPGPAGQPFDVVVVDAVRNFFGVDRLSQVTEDKLKAARDRLGIHPLKQTVVEGILHDMTTTATETARDTSEVCDALRGAPASAVAAACQKGSKDVLIGLQRASGWKGAVTGKKGVDQNLQQSVQRAAVHVGQTVGETVEARSWLRRSSGEEQPARKHDPGS